MAPLDEDGDVRPVLSSIFVVWDRNSTVMVSSGVAGRARGQMYDCLDYIKGRVIRQEGQDRGIGLYGNYVFLILRQIFF